MRIDIGFILRRIIALGCLEGLLYWGVDYQFNSTFWVVTLMFVSITIISIVAVIGSEDAKSKDSEVKNG